MLKIVIKGDPIAKKRPRCKCIGKHGAIYDPQIKDEMQAVRHKIINYLDNIEFGTDDEIRVRGLKLADYYEVDIDFYMPIIKSDNDRTKNLKMWGIIPCNDKPDFDNLAKLYCDAATGILWQDDKLITRGSAHKVKYSKNPRTEIKIMPKKEIQLEKKVSSVFEIFSPEDMENFAQKADKIVFFLETNEQFLKDNEANPDEHFLSTSAMLLMDFADEFADKLKKLTKLCAK